MQSEMCDGIIPTLAGNTLAEVVQAPTRADHPHSRGEYKTGMTFPVSATGSSPLSRGIHRSRIADMELWRIIPTLAGNTIERPASIGTFKDHPHSRGEYSGAVPVMGSGAGSSPLSRGIPTASGASRPIPGIIPTLAGNTRQALPLVSELKDHPHSRGEYDHHLGRGTRSGGSSPLSRGILHHDMNVVIPVRIIPTLAGNTY